MTSRLLLAGLAAAMLTSGTPQQKPIVAFETAAGVIEIEVDSVRAPRTAANFLRYVDAGLYDNGRFHRTVRPDTETNRELPIQVIQAGTDPARAREGFETIAMESTQATGILHKDGVVSMARAASPDSARNQFFICIGDQPSLDFGGKRNPDGQGFAAFGRVVAGMDVVKKIQASPVRPNTQNLEPAIQIVKVRRK